MDSQIRLGNVMVELCCELGRREITLAQARRLKEQDVVELDKLAGEAFEVRVNGRRFAEGEVVVVMDRVAIRITRMVEASAGGGI